MGFCMGGMLSFVLAANRPTGSRPPCPFYGFPAGRLEPGLVEADRDDPRPHGRARRLLPAEAAKALEKKLQDMGKDVQLTVHPGTGHAFMAPHDALGTKNDESPPAIWPEACAFLQGARIMTTTSRPAPRPLARPPT
jgi:carboxymethylenebutenolidase